MSKPVFCRDCKHFKSMGWFEWCTYKVGHKHTPEACLPVHLDHRVANKDNACEHYRQSFWSKIFGTQCKGDHE